MSAKNNDAKGRWRNVTVAFRVSPEENEEINKTVEELNKLSKVQSLLYTKIRAVGNPLMMLSFRKYLQEIIAQLKRIEAGGEIDEEVFVPIRTMLDILDGFEERKKP